MIAEARKKFIEALTMLESHWRSTPTADPQCRQELEEWRESIEGVLVNGPPRSVNRGAEIVNTRFGSARARADAWNRTYPLGTMVRYWTGAKLGEGKQARTRAPAQTLSGHTPVVWVEGEATCISLDHVEAVS